MRPQHITKRVQPRRADGQRGQAMVEFAVVALVLVPLFIAVPLVGKYIDMMQTTELASRYVAFEGAARNNTNSWKTDTELATEVRRRFFSNPGAPLKTGDVAGDFAAHRNPIWSDHAGRPLIANTTDVGVRTTVASNSVIPSSAAWFRSSLGLSNANYYSAFVSVTPAPVANFAPFDTISLATTRRTVVLVDSWSARNLADVRGRIEGSGRAYPIDLAAPLINAIGFIPSTVFDPALVVSAFDWDAVPCDRLIGGC